MHCHDSLTGRMMTLTMLLALVAQTWAAAPSAKKAARKLPTIKDKTLVAWVAPANLEQRGGGVLTLEAGSFDAIVFGEQAQGRWMAGSEMFRRAQAAADQEKNLRETAKPEELVQIATVYAGRSVTLYRNGKRYAQYEIEKPITFGNSATVLMGLRHMERLGMAGAYFAGAIADARIYDRALDATTIAGLWPKKASKPAPLSWWTFEKGKAMDRMGRFPEGELCGGATISNGLLHLDGRSGFVKMALTSTHSPIHFRPAHGVFADPIPFYWKGEYHIFYLRGGTGKVPWEHIVSRDLIHWRELPTALVSDGADDGPDGLHMFTGSVIEKDGTFTIFYTGYNPGNPQGREVIRRATSPDLIHWTKQAGIINPDGVIYANHQARDWRDPYVFWNEVEGRYWMVVNANHATDKKPAQGVLTSPDLAHWTCQQPLAGVGAQECPDLFQIGKSWYLIGGGCYTTAPTPRGPFKVPAQQMIDRPGIYAGKRMFDGKRHIWVGWAWDRTEYRDEGEGGLGRDDVPAPRTERRSGGWVVLPAGGGGPDTVHANRIECDPPGATARPAGEGHDPALYRAGRLPAGGRA